jgi:putative tricarboxylic transport membrane protein
MKRRDIVSGLLVAGVGIFVTQQATTLTYRDEFGPGPGLLPFWLGILMIVLAAFQIVLGILGTRRRSGTEAEFVVQNSASIPDLRKHRVLLAAVGLIATAAGLQTLGFFASFGLLSFFLVYVIERRSLSRALAVTAAITLGFLLLFRVILPLPLPPGPWGF